MFHWKLYEHKALYGMIYHFPQRGDGIGMHTHTEDQKHNCVVLSGSVEVYGPAKEWSVTLKTGDVFDLEDKHHPHEVAALEPNTVILGMFVNGKPENNLDDCPKSGIQANKPLTIPLD
jgi:hypothetical protein